MTPYHATMTRRWHTNPHLSDTCDPVGYHGGRMAVLALTMWNDASRDLLAACVTHDLGEYVSGDIPYMTKKRYPDYAKRGYAIETDFLFDRGLYFAIGEGDAKRLKLLDILDAYLWARHHKPELMEQSDWREQRAKIHVAAIDLNADIEQYGV